RDASAARARFLRVQPPAELLSQRQGAPGARRLVPPPRRDDPRCDRVLPRARADRELRMDHGPILDARGLHKSYGRVRALSGLDLTVGRCEVYGFLGRSGAGKSTTSRVLMGITRVDRGEVRLFGLPARGGHVKLRERIGYVAQEQSFYGWMSARTLGRFVGGFYPTWSGDEFERRCRHLEIPLDRKVQGFSGGMKMKLALCLALAHRPELLILDEPTAGLD